MATPPAGPGPIAERAYDRGFKLAGVGGLAGVMLLYWIGALSLTNPVHVALTILLFPVYLLGVALLLGVWLGYETDEGNLEPADESVEMDSGDPWKYWPPL